MAVQHVIDSTEPRDGEHTSDFHRRYRRIFTVLVDDANDDADVVRRATGIPRVKDPYVTPNTVDLGALCMAVRPRQEQDAPFVWRVECEYDSRHGEQQSPGQGNDNPLDDEAVIEWDAEQFKVIATSWVPHNEDRPDLCDNDESVWFPIRNSAGEPFADPPEIDDCRPLLTIRRNQISYDPLLAWQYTNAINKDPFFGAPPQTAKIKRIAGVSKWQKGAFYWQVTYEIHFQWNKWDLILLDAGKNIRKEVGSEGQGTHKWIWEPIRSPIDGTPVSDPVPLDGKGNPLPPDPASTARHWRVGRVYYCLPFAPLNLP